MAGPLGEPGHVSRARKGRHVEAEILRARHVPVPVGRRPARRPSRRLYGVRHRRALQAHARLQRAAPDGLGRVRPAGRAVRDQDRHASAHHDGTQHQALPRAAEVARLLVRLAARGQHDRPRLLQVDAVDLQAALRARLGVSRGAAGLVVPRARHDARERRGHRRQVRGRRLRVRAPAAAPMGAEDHRSTPTRCSRVSTTSIGRTARKRCSATGSAAAKAPRSTSRSTATPASTAARLHDAARHAVRRDLHGARARARARREAHDDASSAPPSTRIATQRRARASSSARSSRRTRRACSRAPTP